MDEIQENEWISKGNDHLKIKEFSKALSCYQEALELNNQIENSQKNTGTVSRIRTILVPYTFLRSLIILLINS